MIMRTWARRTGMLNIVTHCVFSERSRQPEQDGRRSQRGKNTTV